MTTTTTTTEKSREIKLRRWAKRLGLVLRHSRAKNIGAEDFGRYKLIAASDPRCTIYGSRWELSLDNVEDALRKRQKMLLVERTELDAKGWQP